MTPGGVSTQEFSANSKKPTADLPEIGGARGGGGGGAGVKRVAPDLGERITTPAVQNKHTGKIETQAGADHNQLMNRFYNQGYKPAKGQMQSEHFRNGYMTSAGRFVTPEEAFDIAKARGQLKPGAKYSEHWKELFFDEYKK